MKAYRRLIAVLGVVLFCWAANALLHERDTNDTGALLKLPLDLYENRKSAVITVGLLTICPLAIVVNHLGWLVARRSHKQSRLRRIATLDEFRPGADEPESFVYAFVFASVYHVFPLCVATHLFVRLFTKAPSAILWDFTASGFFSGNKNRFEGISYYGGWMTPLIILLYSLLCLSFLRTACAIIRDR